MVLMVEVTVEVKERYWWGRVMMMEVMGKR